MDVRSAAFTKYAANAMLATCIRFMNELAHRADAVGADIELVRKGIGSDPRIGKHFLCSGTGYGGSCVPKDVKAPIRTGRSKGVRLRVLGAVEEANDLQKRVLGHVAGFSLTNSAEAALEGADALLIVTEWREFRTPDFNHIKATLKQPLVLDGRNLCEPNLMRSLGIDYVDIGRGVRAVRA